MPDVAALLRALLALPPWYGDLDEDPGARVARLSAVAEVVSVVSEGEPTRAAAVLALGWHESRWARYVGEGRCSEGPAGARCDPDSHGRPRATSYWQVWAVACPGAHAFPAGSRHSLEAAAWCADRLLRGGYTRCRGRHPAGDVAGAFAALRGLDCTWRGGAPRARTTAALVLSLMGETR